MAPRKPKTLKNPKKSNKDTKVTLGDTAGMKYALDSAVVECLVENGYEVDNTYSNLRLVVGFLAISLAAVAQFYPGKLEENWFLILFCVVTYVAISGFLALFVYFIEKDAIMITKKGKVDSIVVVCVKSVGLEEWSTDEDLINNGEVF